MTLFVEISDTWGWLAAIGLSLLLAENSFRNGRLAYRFGFYLSGGNLLISLAMYLSNGGSMAGGILEVGELFIAAIISYLSYLGFSVTFRAPRSVECFRCKYVGYPSETSQISTPHDEEAWAAFRKLNTQFQRDRLGGEQ